MPAVTGFHLLIKSRTPNYSKLLNSDCEKNNISLITGVILFVPTIIGADNLFDLIRESTDWEILKEATEQLTVEDILSTNANIDSRNADGETVLMLATIYNENPPIIQAILDKGANVNARDITGFTALMMAVASKVSPTVIQALINSGADVNAGNKYGNTVLIIAAEYNNDPAVIHVLLDANPDITMKNKDNKTAWDLVQENEDLKGTDAYWRLNNLRFK